VIRVNCPQCGTPIEIDETRRTGRGKLRINCGDCGNRFSIKVTRKAPRKSEEATLISMPPGVADGVGDPAESPQNLAAYGMDDGDAAPAKDPHRFARGVEQEAGTSSSVWARPEDAAAATEVDSSTTPPQVVSAEIPSAGEGGEAELPPESDAFDELADGEVALPGDPDEESHTGGFEDLADGEVALPGDPDDDTGSLDEEDESVVLHISVGDEDESVVPPPDEPGADEEPLADDAGATGMSMEMEVPIARRVPAALPEIPPDAVAEPSMSPDPLESSIVPPAGAGGTDPDRNPLKDVVVSNLPSLPASTFEPMGMVTHHFCRLGGGDKTQARRRVRAFGARYRRALEELARNALEMGADTVLGVEVTLQPTGPADEPIVWILVQGTAGRRTPSDP